MSKDALTFYNYLISNSTDNTSKFIDTFKDKIHNIPDGNVNSRTVYRALDITTYSEFRVFQNAFMEFFKVKLDQ
jgi:hypothetical protein